MIILFIEALLTLVNNVYKATNNSTIINLNCPCRTKDYTGNYDLCSHTSEDAHYGYS